MDYLTHTNSNKYVIWLDNLDMGLLRTYSARPKNSASLWSANLNRSSKDYFEFLVKPKTDSDMFDVDSTVNNESTKSINRSTLKKPNRENTTICHICDIDLPAAYVVDHENSLKHKANIKITDIVLSRSRKHILKKSSGYVQKDYSTYFCEPCASEVKLDDKHIHEKSKSHEKSVSLDKVLYELATLYTDHEHEESCASNTIDDEKVDDEKIDDEKIDDMKIDEEKFIENEVDDLMNEIEGKSLVISNMGALLEDIDYDEQFKDYNIKIFTGDCEVTVAQDHYNGLIWLDENHKFCIVCKLIVDQEKTHKFSLTHRDNIGKPFKDRNLIRDLDNSRSHCVICNKIVNDSNYHVLCDTAHIELLQEALVFNEYVPKTRKDPIINASNLESFTKIDDETYLCKACNIKLHVNNIESHSMGNKHAINSKSNVHYNMMKGIGSVDLICRVCKVYVADEVDEVKAHVATKDHAQKYTDLLANNHVIQKQGNFYCKPCNLVVSKRNELYHIEKLTHETNLGSCSCPGKVPSNPNNIRSHNEGPRYRNNLLKPEEEVADSIEDSEFLELRYHMDATDNEKSLMCKVCKVVVPNTEDGINQHVRGKKHDAAFQIIMDTNHIESVDEKYFCKVCNVDIKTHNIFKHINQKKHLALLGNAEKPETAAAVERLNLETKIETKHKEIDSNTVDVSEESVDALYLKFKHHFVELENNKWLKCKVCLDIDIPNTFDNVAIHARGKAHMDEYKKLLSSNLIFETKDRRYYCAVCDCYIPLTGEVNHTKGNRHTGNFTHYFSRETCNICDVDSTSTNMRQHMGSLEHFFNILKRL